MRSLAIHVVAFTLLATSCGAMRGPDLVQPVGETHTTASATGGARAQGVDGPAAPIVVAVADEVRRACDLSTDRIRTSSFSVESARLRPRGDDTLARIAACVASGRLGDEPILLVGHTDPRGEPEYNRQLGEYRAIAAKQYLVELGISAGRIAVESRGARDAKGTDEASWARDRTIEIRIGRGPGDIPR